MPHYDYRCLSCGDIFEEFKSIKDADEEQKCPVCGEVSRRLISGGNFILKGDGWASDGYSDKVEVKKNES